MPNTACTIKLEERRNSKEVQEFKNRVITFLITTNASEEISYRLKCDLSKKIDMPFYGEKKIKPVCRLSVAEIAKEYIRLLISYGDEAFSNELLTWLVKQQSQTFRRIHKLSSYQKSRKQTYKIGVFEHPVPANYSKNFLVDCIRNKNIELAYKYIDFMDTQIPQIFLRKEEDLMVNQIFKDDMPENWNFEQDSPFIRYILAGIDENIYNK